VDARGAPVQVRQGTGSNFSMLRGENEPLSGGGKSSGLMSFLRIGDRAAGAIKSGGTTRRAAKMVCLDLDHPDIETFVNWKVREEQKVAALVAGSKLIRRTSTPSSTPATCRATAARAVDRRRASQRRAARRPCRRPAAPCPGHVQRASFSSPARA
jgi:ribonucleoside-diphosphate reductase alpha chain